MKIFIIAFLFVTNGWAITQNCKMTATEVGATTISYNVLSKNANRRCLYIQNKGALPVFVKFDSDQSTNQGVLIGSSVIWQPVIAPMNKLYIRSSSGTQAVVVGEGE
jgi:hypothetical protein